MKNEELDEIRRGIQEALSQAKKELPRNEYGGPSATTDSSLTATTENEWVNYLSEFDRQLEEAKTITVRERIGDPPILPVSEVPLYALDEAINTLLDLLAEHGIAVDFLGEFDDVETYRCLTEELLNEEMDDIRIEGMMACFTYSTPENDVEMWVGNFVSDVFGQEREYFLPGLAHQPLFNMQGEPITAAQFQQQLEVVWQRLSPTRQVSVEPITVQVDGEKAEVRATISWYDEVQQRQRQIKSYFRLQPSPYTGWDVVQTSLLDDLLV
jgi:hypothetical protein